MFGSVGPACNPGIPHRVATLPSSEGPASLPPILSGRDGVSGVRYKSDAEKQAISQVGAHSEWQGFLSSIFLVPKKDGRHRPIINLKKFNKFIPHTHFKMEGIHMLKDLLRQGDFLAKIDLKDAYVLCGTNKRKPEVQVGEQNIPIQLPIPFGLSCTPWVFTKITKAVVAILRESGSLST